MVDACGGGCGKTWLAKYIRANHHSLYFKTTDMAAVMHLFVDHDVVVFDLSRQASVHINYDTLECLKDGVASDTHSGGKERMFVPPSVVVMMHCGPDMVALSNDRYCIHSSSKLLSASRTHTPTNQPTNEPTNRPNDRTTDHLIHLHSSIPTHRSPLIRPSHFAAASSRAPQRPFLGPPPHCQWLFATRHHHI